MQSVACGSSPRGNALEALEYARHWLQRALRLLRQRALRPGIAAPEQSVEQEGAFDDVFSAASQSVA
jgi:hypothetical protein